jgi:hypothetical protein
MTHIRKDKVSQLVRLLLQKKRRRKTKYLLKSQRKRKTKRKRRRRMTHQIATAIQILQMTAATPHQMSLTKNLKRAKQKV